MTTQANNTRAAGILILAGIVFFILSQFYVGRLMQWPFVIVSTFVHEMGHGLMAILMGGDFLRMDLYSNGGGTAYSSGVSSGIPRALVAAGGLVAPSLCAGLFILLGRTAKASSRLLVFFSLVIIVSCAIWVRTGYGLLVLLTFAAFFLLVSQKAKGVFDQFLVQFMGMHMMVDALTRTLGYLYTSNVNVGGEARTSDTTTIANNLGGSYLIWATLIATLCFFILWFSIKRAYFSKARR